MAHQAAMLLADLQRGRPTNRPLSANEVEIGGALLDLAWCKMARARGWHVRRSFWE